MKAKGRNSELVPLGPRFSSALAYAADLHANQARKGTSIPYVAHLLAVAALVIEHGGDEDQAIAALLHDAVEDQGGLRIRSRMAGYSSSRTRLANWALARLTLRNSEAISDERDFLRFVIDLR